MARPLPAVFLRSEEEDIRAKVEDTRGLTVEDRWRILDGLCRLAAQQIGQQPDPQRTLDHHDPPPEESERLLARLRQEFRAATS